jgi:hypothetical protein
MAVIFVKLSTYTGIVMLFPGQGFALPTVVTGASRQTAILKKGKQENKSAPNKPMKE